MSLTRSNTSYVTLDDDSKKDAIDVKATYSETMPSFLTMFEEAVSKCHSQIAIDDSDVIIPGKSDKETGKLSYTTLDKITTILAKQIRECLRKNVHGAVLRQSISGLKHQSVPGDGHCLFNAVALYTGETQEFLRSIVAAHIEHNQKEYRERIQAINQSKTFEKYLEDLRQGIEWADNVEIAVLMKLLNRPIVIVGPDGQVRNKSDLIGSDDPIFVYYNGHNHYDAFILTGEKTPREIFEALSQLVEPSRLSQSLVDANNNPPRIGVYMPHSALPVICLLAIWKAGCVYVPLSQESHATAARLSQIVEDCEISLLLTHPSCHDHYFIGLLKYNATHSLPILEVSRKELELQISSNQPVDFESVDLNPNQLAYIIYSSGTTGTPKGIAINHGGLYAPTVAHHEILKIKKDKRVALYSDVAFDPFVMEVMTTLGVSDQGGGGTLYIVPTAIKQDPKKIGLFYKDKKIQVAVFTPSMLDLLDPGEFLALKCVISMGERLPKEVLNKWKGKKPKLIFVNGYGPTEVSICTSLGECDTDHWSAGPIIKGLQGYVLSSHIDQHSREEKPSSDKQVLTSDMVSDKLFLVQRSGEEGELFIQGAGIGRYWKHEQRNKERFFKELYVKEGDEIYCLHNVYRTGDLVKRDEKGNLEIIRRIDREIKLNDGRRYDVEPYETSLSKHSKVASAQIGTLDNKFLVALIRAKQEFDETSLHTFIEELWASIASNLVSGLLINPPTETIVGSSTKMDIDKIIKKHEKEIHKRQGVTFNEPTLKIESLQGKLASIWGDILSVKKESLTPESHFFQLGGNSFLAYQLVEKLKTAAETGISKGAASLSTDEISDYPTIAALARRLGIAEIANNLMQTVQDGNKTEMPLFLIPSITGDGISDYKGKVEKWVPQNMPIYTFQAAGFDDSHLIAESIREMAGQYLIAVLSKLRESKKEHCFILGYSSGGAIAYEMAIQLQEKHHIKAEIILVDSLSPVLLQQMSNDDHAAYLASLDFANRIGGLVGVRELERIDYKESLKEYSSIYQIKWIFEKLLTKANNDENIIRKLKVMRAIALSHYSYTSRNYLKNVTLLKAETLLRKESIQSYIGQDSLGWPLSREIILIPKADHFTILEEAKDLLTSLLRVRKPVISEIRDHYCQQRKIKTDAFDSELYQATRLSSGEDVDGTKKLFLIKDLFKPDSNSRLPKRISIIGHSGTGKSIFCQYLAYSWASQKLWQDEFALVVYVPLKHLASYSDDERTIAHVIYKEYLNTACSVQEVQTFLNSFPKDKNILYILDGFDEVSDLACESPAKATPQGNLIRELLDQEHVIITSQPYCIKKYLSSIWMPKLLNQELEINGFIKKDIGEYIKRFFKKYKGKKAPEYIDSLRSLLKGNISIYDIGRTPLILSLICRAWGAQDLTGSKAMTMTQLYQCLLQYLCLRYLQEKLGTQFDKANLEHILDHAQCKPIVQFLRQLAYDQMKEPTSMISEERWHHLPLKEQREIKRFGLIITDQGCQWRNESKYYFIHSTFQQFVAASYIVQKYKENSVIEIGVGNEWNFENEWNQICLYNFVIELIRDQSIVFESLIMRFFDEALLNLSHTILCMAILEQSQIRLNKAQVEKISRCLNEFVISDMRWEKIKKYLYGCKDVYSYIKDTEVDNSTVSRLKEWIIAEETPSPLHRAAQEGDIVNILDCLQRGDDINQVNYLSQTPLYIAVHNYKSKSVEVLLNAKANPNVATKEGVTPMHLAAYQGSNTIVAMLLNNGGDKLDINVKDNNGCTPLHFAVTQDQNNVVAQLLKLDDVNVNAKDNNGKTPLHFAVQLNHSNVTAQLINHSKVDINVKDTLGCTPLHVAVEQGQSDVVSQLLDYDKLHDRVEFNIKDNFGCTPLHRAVLRNQSNLVARLIECNKVKVNTKQITGCTPLHIAAQLGYTNVAARLLDHDKINVNDKTNKGMTPLHFAASKGQSNLVALLLQYDRVHDKVKVNAKDNYGRTPLHFAAATGQSNVVAQFLEYHKVDINPTENKYGFTPLRLAAYRGQTNVVELLLMNKKVDVNIKGHDGITLLHRAADLGQIDMIERLLKHDKVDIDAKEDNTAMTPLHVAIDRGQSKVVELLLKHGHTNMDVNVKDKYGMTPLHLAVLRGQSNLVALLLEYDKVHDKVMVNATDNNFWTPLHWAIAQGQSNAAELLINYNKTDVNAKNEDGSTPLHIATMYGERNVVASLLNHEKVDVNARNWFGKTPLHLAAMHGQTNVAALLLDQGKIDINIIDASVAPLHYAVELGYCDIVKLLIAYGARLTPDRKIFSKSSEEKTAKKNNMTAVIVLLREYKENPTIAEQWKREFKTSQQVSSNDVQVIANNTTSSTQNKFGFFSSSTTSSTQPTNNSKANPRPS